MLLATGSVTAVLTLTDSACRVVVGASVEDREEGVGDTSTSVWAGLRRRTVPLGIVVAAAAALIGTGTWRPGFS